jgi:hypothetical protein
VRSALSVDRGPLKPSLQNSGHVAACFNLLLLHGPFVHHIVGQSREPRCSREDNRNGNDESERVVPMKHVVRRSQGRSPALKPRG